MAFTRTLAQLRSGLLIRAGMNTSGTSVDLTATVLNEIINDAIYEGWDVIVNKWLDYFTTSGTVAVVAGTSSYAVPTDFYKFRMLEHSDQQKLKPVSLDERGRYYGQSGLPRRYLLINRSVSVFPTPSAAESLTLWYVPIKTAMSSDSDSLTLDVPIEFKFIMAIAWRDILDRQNLDPSPAIQKVDKYEKSLRTAADSLDASEPFYLGGMPDNDDLLSEVD